MIGLKLDSVSPSHFHSRVIPRMQRPRRRQLKAPHLQGPIIRIHAQFGTSASATSPWHHFLKFPVNDLNRLQFSNKPYKWLRYAAGVVIGAEGHLQYDRDASSPIVNYNAESLPDVDTDLYYHVSDTERENMFPLDPQFANDECTTSTGASSVGRADFRRRVMARDEGLCVVSDLAPESCDAVHLVPFSKGDMV